MNKSINQEMSGDAANPAYFLIFLDVLFVFISPRQERRNPKLSRGLGGAVPLSPEPHSGGNVFNGPGRVEERSGPAAY